ncbi:iron-hydroxamate ABC transporter substrate-binding protein [Neobacillus ginsengisoli]|uniref:Iron complex transport system substrate-binding protein n=1 Tax=Neobacillus ginsengisoli TaxID=904295 RepID=A0ABT9XTT3_9BACI|nr:iron-hydroxamate ABC transporter substrate-binding protein [Neobacillus ginsengisoli]MDQ0198924.1 iron complex transport system substrate-binding protein [Neobacillus ginsengisoli]
MKKKITILISFMLIVLLTACGQNNSKVNNVAKNEKDGSEEPKIASLSIHLTNDLLALGITPAGSVIGGELKDFLPHVKDQLKNTEKLGIVKDPDMEALLELKPSVIYLDNEFSGQDVSKYKKIAPTHIFDLNDGTWRDHLISIGKLVNREKQADQFIENYEKESKDVQALIKDKLGDDSKVMAIRVTAKELRVFGTKKPMGPILFQDLGLKPANGVGDIDKNQSYEVISQEVLPDFDADAIFVIVNRDDKSQTAFKELEKTPIWKGLKAVKEKHVYLISDQPWLDYSALGNKMAMDNAKKIFSN